MMIPPLVISEPEKQQLEETLRKGNQALEAFCPSKKRRIAFRRDILAECEGLVKSVIVWGVEIPADEVSKILDVHKIQWKVLRVYSGFIKQESRKRNHLPDVYENAIEIALKATVYYTKEDVRFSTYLYWCLVRNLGRVFQQHDVRSHFTVKAIELYRKFKEIERSFNGPCTYDDIVLQMNLSEKEKGILHNTLVSVFSQSSCETEFEDASDYSELGVVYNDINGNRSFEVVGRMGRSRTDVLFRDNNARLDMDMREAIEKADLTDMERAVVEGVRKNISYAEIARKFTNPKTGKPYSRMNIIYAFRRAKRKILKEYSSISSIDSTCKTKVA